MHTDRSVTQWIADLKVGEEDEAQFELWERYFARLVGLARDKLGCAPRGVEDEEDVALSALESFFGGVRKGHFPELLDRNGLWPLLAKITARKAINQRKRQMAAKRGGGRVINAASATRSNAPDETARFDPVHDDLTPDMVVAISEECQRLIDLLPDPALQKIARQKLAGFTTTEIAEQLGVAPRTVERKTSLIRTYWEREIAPASGE